MNPRRVVSFSGTLFGPPAGPRRVFPGGAPLAGDSKAARYDPSPLGADHTVAMFGRLAPGYDRMNKVVSLGLDGAWRRSLAAALGPLDGARVLDLATGTGDVALELAARGAMVTATDLSEEMLGLARKKAEARGLEVDFARGDADSPEGDGYDAVTIAFGLRNIPDALGAVRRQAAALRPGGVWACLEAMEPDGWALRALSRAWSAAFPAMARVMGADPEAYRYLGDSMRTFPRPGAAREMLVRAGLEEVSVRGLFPPMAVLMTGRKSS